MIREKMVKVNNKPTYRGVYQRTDKQGVKTFYINYRVNGKPTWEKIGAESDGYTAAMSVQKRIARIQEEKRGELADNKMTLNQAFARYEESLRISGSRYVDQEVQRYTKHVKPRLGQLPLKDITMSHLERLKGEITGMVYTPDERMKLVQDGTIFVQEPTAYLILAQIRRVIKRMSDLGLYHGRNPVVMKQLGWKEPKRKRDRYLSEKEVLSLLKKLKDIDVTTYRQSAFAAYAGLRRNEIFQITPSHVDLVNKRLINIKTKDKNAKRVRSIELPSDLVTIIEEMMQERQLGPDEPFFRGSRNGGFNYNHFLYACDQLGLNNGVDPRDRTKKITLHSLRHAFASNELRSGRDVRTVQHLLGHQNLASTMIYLNPSEEACKDAAEKGAERRELIRKEIEAEDRKVNLKVLQGGKV